MPEGPFGFPRPKTFGPLSRETEEELREEWSDCDAAARDNVDVKICKTIKRKVIKVLDDQDIRPKCQTLEEINQGLCGVISNEVMEEFNNPEIKEVETGGMNWLHRFIEYRGRYFDAETPTGVNDPSDIKMHQRMGRTIDPDRIAVIFNSTEFD